MSTEGNTGSHNLVVVTQQENPSFLTDSIQLKKLLKTLDKVSKDAIAVLEKALDSNDEKTRVQAATKILEFYVSTAKEVNTDQMQRLIAEIKLNRAPQAKLIPVSGESEEADKKQRPVVDFTQIRQV